MYFGDRILLVKLRSTDGLSEKEIDGQIVAHAAKAFVSGIIELINKSR